MTIDIPTLHIADIELPPSMERLRDLAYDLSWCWSHEAIRLFAWIDPQHWRQYRNPVELLINVDPRHWQGGRKAVAAGRWRLRCCRRG